VGKGGYDLMSADAAFRLSVGGVNALYPNFKDIFNFLPD